MDGDADGDTDTDADGDADRDGDGDVDGDIDGDGDSDMEPDGDADGDGDWDADADRESDGDVDSSPDGDADGDVETDASPDADGDSDYTGAVCGDTVVEDTEDCDPPGVGDGADCTHPECETEGFRRCASDCNWVCVAEEVCNECDDDSNGIEDDVAGLLTDLENCGECGHRCLDDLTVAEDELHGDLECSGGACVMTDCVSGYHDVNRNSADGCEHYREPGGTIYVNARAGEGGDGSEESPFLTIAEALAEASAGTTIQLLRGPFSERVNLDHDFMTLRGNPARPSSIVLNSTLDAHPVVRINANHTTVEGITFLLSGATYAVNGARIENPTIADNRVSISDWHGGRNAFRLEEVTNASVRGNLITASLPPVHITLEELIFVNGSSCLIDGNTITATGVVDGSSFLTMSAGITVQGEDNRVVYNTISIDQATGCAVGIVVESVRGEVTGNRIIRAISQHCAEFTIDRFYPISGIYVARATRLRENEIRSVGGSFRIHPSTELREDRPCGIRLVGSEALRSELEGNTVEDVVIHVLGPDVTTLSDIDVVYAADYPATNYGTFLVVDPDDLLLEHVSVTSSAGPALNIVGNGNVFIGDSTFAHSREETVVEMTEEDGSLEVELSSNAIYGGTTGLLGRGVSSFVSDHNVVAQLNGGAAFGYDLMNVSFIELSNDIFTDIEGSGIAQALHMAGTSTGGVYNVTIAGIRSDTPDASGGMWWDSPNVVVEIVSFIISAVDGYCLYNNGGAAMNMSHSYSDLWSCSAGLTVDAEDGGDNISADPGFISLDDGDLHLRIDSPCIDSGHEDADFSLEPWSNGCQINMGAYGNTPEATSAEGARHCD